MASSGGMGSLSKAIAEFDPLKAPAPRMPDEPSNDAGAAASTSSNPLSFKRRTASKSHGLRGGLLGGLLKSDGQEDLVPPVGGALHRPDAPRRIELPPAAFQKAGHRVTSQALATESDEEEDNDDDDDLDDGQRTPTSTFPSRVPSRGGPHRGRLSFGQAAGRWNDGSPRRPPGSPSGRSDISIGPAAPEAVTPLPLLSITVLCLAMFGEFLSASTSSPFLYFMIEDFGIGKGPGGGGEAAVGFWTGIVGSVFFLSQFLTSLLWVSVAEKHGRRAVLFTSLFGNGLSLVAFGTSKNLGTAICVRLTMGIFNGAVGVARSAVQSITDPTNESQAFTLMGLAWGLGGIVGSIIGGLTENPVRNHPYFFGDSKLFAEYPYLLPCIISSSVTFTGALLSTFLGPDGGPREGGIRLPTDKDVTNVASSVIHFPRSMYRYVTQLAGVAKKSQPVALAPEDAAAVRRVQSSGGLRDSDRASLASVANKSTRYGSAFAGAQAPPGRRVSVAAPRFGSAYGFDRPRRNTNRSMYRAMSVATSTRYAPDYEDLGQQDLNFAQRLLLANEPAVFSLSDIWVANATRNDDVDYDSSVFERDDDEESRLGVEEQGFEPDFDGYGSVVPSVEDLKATAKTQDLMREQAGDNGGSPAPSSAFHTRNQSPSVASSRHRTDASALAVPHQRAESVRSPGQDAYSRVFSGPRLRRPSAASSMRGPAIFANTGLDPSSLALASPSAAVERGPPFFPTLGGTKSGADTPNESTFNIMAAIPESGGVPSIAETDVAEDDEKSPPSLIRQLPVAMIAQYSLLALHGTTCDQVFMSFLVTPIPSGGLGLKASNYALLVALMVFFQTLWQFRFYPFVVAPRGIFSHLAMFRLGLLFYIPVYLLFPELRGLLRESGNNFWVMFGMTVLSAIRYLGNTCSYTATSVLINAMTPPHLVPLANGLAQSCVSLSRFIGPILGGTLWATSISDGPNAHKYPFNYAFPFIVVACLCGLGFLHSWRIR